MLHLHAEKGICNWYTLSRQLYLIVNNLESIQRISLVANTPFFAVIDEVATSRTV